MKPFLVTEDILTHFVAFQCKEGLIAETVKSYLDKEFPDVGAGVTLWRDCSLTHPSITQLLNNWEKSISKGHVL